MELKPIANFKRTNVYKRNAEKGGWQVFDADQPDHKAYLRYSTLTLDDILTVFEVTHVALFGGCISIRMGK